MKIEIFPKKIGENNVGIRLVLKVNKTNSEDENSASVSWKMEDVGGHTIDYGHMNLPFYLNGNNQVIDHVINGLNLQKISLNNLKKMKSRIQEHMVGEKIVTWFVIDYIQIREFNDTGVAVASWSFLSEDEIEPIYSGSTVIEGEEYSNWGSDDSYVMDLLLQKLGLTRATDAIIDGPETVIENILDQEILDQLDN